MKSPALDVSYVARLARLALTDEETAQFQAQLSQVLAYVASLENVDVSRVKDGPVDHAGNFTRADTPRPGLSSEEALANAPARSGELFQTVRVVE